MADTIYNILLVDDEEGVLRSLQRTLRNDRYQIHTFTDPEMALLEAEKIQFDLVISDYRMPRMDGVTFLGKLIALQPRIQRIMLSGYADLRAVMAAINEVGIYKFLTKPWKDDELRQVVTDSLKKDRGSNLQSLSTPAEKQLGAMAELETRYPGITHGVWNDDDSKRW